MLSVQNSRALFCRLCFVGLTSVVSSFCFLSKSAVSVSTQQCEQELMIYCPPTKFSSPELKKQCVQNRQDLFTGSCVDKILGTTLRNQEDDNNQDKGNHQTPGDNINELELELQEYQKNVKDKENQIEQKDNQISILTKMVLRKNCINEIIKFCRTRTKHRRVIIKESLDECIDKLVKHDRYLTLNCQNALLNIISPTSNQQYMIYNVGGINFKSGPNLKKIRKKQKTTQQS